MLFIKKIMPSQAPTSVHNQVLSQHSLFDITNDYPFEMRICACVIKPFDSLQVVICLIFIV